MRLRSLLDSFGQHRIFGGALVLALTQLGASIAGLVRDRVLTRTFPSLDTVDVYLASFRPSDLLFQITIMAGFSVALVPLLARYKADGKERDMDELLNGVTGAAAIAFGIVALILAVFFDRVAPYLVHFEGEAFDLYVSFGRMALLTNFLFVFGNAFGQYLITIQRYWIYGLTPILYTLGTIAGTLWLTPYYGSLGPMLGTLGGAVVYVLVRFVSLLWIGYRPSIRMWHPDIKELGWLMLPRMLALGALQFELLLFDNIASGLGAGAVTINAYARNFQSVVIGVAGIALAQSAYSMLSQAAAKHEATRFWIYLKKGLLILLALTIPGSIVLWLVAPVAAWLVHLSDVLPVFATCLGLYALSIPFESANHLLLRAFYSLKNTTIPAIFSVANGLAAIVVSWALSAEWGVYALALGFTAGQVLQTVGLAVMLRGVARKRL